MIIRNLRSGRRLAVLAVFAIVAVSAFGFAAQNTVGDSRAGDGTGDILPYDVTNIHYTLNTPNPATIATVSFDLDYTATTVAASIGSSTATCAAGVGYDWTCTFGTPPSVELAVLLRVVAAQ